MSDQPQSDRTRAKGVPQYHLAPCTRRGFTPKNNETNPIFTYQVSRPPRFLRNEPNLPPQPSCPMRKTQNETPSGRTRAPGGPPIFNPGLSAGDPTTTQNNETNPIYPHTHPVPCQKTRNEPNLSPFRASHAARRSVPIHRETQFYPHGYPPHDQFGETNPIPVPVPANPAGQRPVPARRGTQFAPPLPSADPKNRNEPNFRIPGTPPTPISAKRTQFTPPPAWPTTKNAKQTQSSPISSQPRWPKVSPDSSGNPIPAPANSTIHDSPLTIHYFGARVKSRSCRESAISCCGYWN